MSNSLVIEIPQALFASAESASFDGKYFPEHLHNGPDEYHFEKPCAYHIDVQKVDDAIIFSGTISAETTTLCGRCLDEVSYHLESDIDAYFLINEPGHEATHDEAEEFDILPPDHKIDLQPLLHGALLLELPLVALCKDDCAGLCHICGENKNIHICTCNEQAALDAADEKNAENPFAVLRNLDFSE